MKTAEYRKLRELEDAYWWYQVLRENVVRRVAGALGNTAVSARVLDAGCGTGGTLAALRQAFPAWELTGLDVDEFAVKTTVQRGLGATVFRSSINRLPFSDRLFDAVISLDVLYHAAVEEDTAMAELHRVLKPNAPLLLNLPAFDVLRGTHDLATHGRRRYTPAGVRALAQRHGFHADFLTCWNTTLAPATWLLRRGRRTAHPLAKSDLRPLPAWLNACLRALARLEWRVANILPLPAGTSVFAVLRKARDS